MKNLISPVIETLVKDNSSRKNTGTKGPFPFILLVFTVWWFILTSMNTSTSFFGRVDVHLKFRAFNGTSTSPRISVQVVLEHTPRSLHRLWSNNKMGENKDPSSDWEQVKNYKLGVSSWRQTEQSSSDKAWWDHKKITMSPCITSCDVKERREKKREVYNGIKFKRINLTCLTWNVAFYWNDSIFSSRKYFCSVWNCSDST